MNPKEVPPMPPQVPGPAIPIPARTSSKHALETIPKDELIRKRTDMVLNIGEKRKKLKMRTSCDSVFWSSTVEILDMEMTRQELHTMAMFRQHTEESNSNATYDEWLHSTEVGIELSSQKSAMDLKLSAAKSQATRLAKDTELDKSWRNLFLGAPTGFGLNAASYGQRDNSAQARMRKEMFEKYHEEGISEEKPDMIWEPICRNWFRSEWLHAAHLYPSKSIEHMDIIFGDGASDRTRCSA
ncbi:hypothetical protein F4779DRAFT_611525 [Xylariaceae sp. FL0662B]|nr:hypothetical protein F4779DRAFT_611525 [Xylariaceae sp. FL0662B]